MKKLLTYVAMLTLLLGCLCAVQLPANAATEGDYKYEVADGKATITKYTGTGGYITIPATLGGYPVTAIGDYVFYWRTSLTAVTIPDSVQTIGENAFYNCASLTTVTIGDSVQTIGDYAFCNCTSLTTLTIPGSVQTISEYAFYNCASLTAVTIPDSVQTIGKGAFSFCPGLTGIWVSENNPNYCSDEWGVLLDKEKTLLIQAPGAISDSYTIPDSVQAIGILAFGSCASLTAVTIPDSVQTIGEGAFTNCASLTYNVYDNAKYLGNDTNPYVALIEATSKSISTCQIHPSTRVIGYRAFTNCTSLTAVTIPDSVQTIDEYAFYNCTGLTGIWVSENNHNYCSDELGVLFDKEKTLLIQAPGTISGSYTIPDGVQAIGNYAFVGCDSLTTATIPDSVQTIGNYAFSGCDSLTEVTIGDSVQTIGKDAFYNCTGLTAVTIGNGVQTIGYRAFYKCANLTSVTIPDGVQTIGEESFTNCTSLTSVTIGNGVQTIGDYAFYECTSLTDVYYTGTLMQWGQIEIGENNEALFGATIHCKEVQITIGDVDGVEGVSVDDAIYLLQSILMPELFPVEQPADFNADGATNIDDAIYLLQHVLMPELFPLK